MNYPDWVSRSRAALWHPCTQMKQLEAWPPLPIARGEGPWLIDYQDRRYLDAISSWWVNLFGHANGRINAALKDQLDRIEHVMLAGCTHAPVVELSERLADLTGLGHAFYGSDGASATEIALKMSFHYWRNVGRPEKTGFISLAQSYHGETLGALAVTDVPIFKATYAPLLRSTHQVMSPDWRQAELGESPVDVARRAAADLEAWLDTHADTTAALILEPLVQGAAGMAMYDPVYLTLARQLCDRYQVHLIADEIAVGFGRTGTLFACEQAPSKGGAVPCAARCDPVAGDGIAAGRAPVAAGAGNTHTGKANDIADLLCLSKGITGGYLPLSCVLTTDAVYAAFYADETARGFLHSHSYTGNPLACRAALAVLDIFAADRVLDTNQGKAKAFTHLLAPVAAHPRVRHFRHTGMIWAFDVADAQPGFARWFHQNALEEGVFIRPIGGSVYFMPPYVVEAADLARLADSTLRLLRRLPD